MISYYDLLGMIKEGNAPRKIRVHLTCNPRDYEAIDDMGEFCYYSLIGEPDENYKSYLSESYVESCMLEDGIEVIEEDNKIERLEQWVDVKSWVGNDLKRGLEEQSEFNKNIYYKINEIIDYINTHCKD